MEDSYANYTIDPEALRQGLEGLGTIVAIIGIGVGICNPAGAAIAGLCTAVGVGCSALSTVSYLSEGDVEGAVGSVASDLTGKGVTKLGRLGFGKMLTGAELTEEEIEKAAYLFCDIPELAGEKALKYKGALDEINVKPMESKAGQKVIDTVCNCVSQLPPIPEK